MRRFQFTVRALLMAVVVVALGSAALIDASPLWRWIVMLATVIILTFALLRALMPGRDGGGFRDITHTPHVCKHTPYRQPLGDERFPPARVRWGRATAPQFADSPKGEHRSGPPGAVWL